MRPTTCCIHPLSAAYSWDDARPGFVEVDLVAHCGPTTAGQYLNSLNLTDIATGWTECLGVLNKGQRHVNKAITAARRHLPSALPGLDANNASECINDNLSRYCAALKITFTRSCECHTNDQAHVEDKHWSVLRRFVGYDRFEGSTALRMLEALYRTPRLYVNFFLPVQKLVSKERVGKVIRRYDQAKTSYRRAPEHADIGEDSNRM